MKYLVPLLTLALCSACTQQETRLRNLSDDAGRSTTLPATLPLRQSIIGGSEVDSNDPIKFSVFSLVQVIPGEETAGGQVGPAGFGICSSVLIAPNLILTAAHCVSGATKALNPHSLFIATGDLDLANSNNLPPIVHVTEVRVHPKYYFNNKVAVQGTDDYDIALVKLAEPMPAPSKPVRFLNAAYDLKQSPAIKIAGFGCQTLNCLGNNDNVTLRSTDSQILNLSKKSLLVLLTGIKNGAVADGDSGGPAFTILNGQALFWGIARDEEADGDHSDSYEYQDVRKVQPWFILAAKQMDVVLKLQ